MVQPPGLRCYATLNVSPYADSKALVSAYRRLALQTHPDKNNNTVEANEKFKEQLSHTFEYLNDDTRRKEYDRIVATAYAQLNRELAEYYKELHDVRQKIRQSETLHMNSGTNAGWHNGMPTSDMDKESQLLKRIDLKYQELVPLNGEIRQIPANPGKTLPTDHLGSGLDFWRASSQCQEKRAERLQQQVTNQQKALGIKETEIMGLKTQNERLREKVYKLSRENDCQKKLVREKTAVVDALKERSKNVREEKDQLLELNRRRNSRN
ncbi:DnaJ-domain-containing protein [Neurospora tetraspora]|uniref:DnaJ-domain-containing protein n=1 Tax=Neurospora tetraspora TaxID=94610 RepID=A0AAE0MJT7_9PEZI|nr:DnaJ-domain-containing protein [Neurospora tetraspora]